MRALAQPHVSIRPGHDEDRAAWASSGAYARGAGHATGGSQRQGRQNATHLLRLRVLVVFEDEYRSYGEVIAAFVRSLRPRTAVEISEPDALAAEVARMAPHVVISSQPRTGDADATLAWVHLPSDPTSPTTIHCDGRASRTVNPTLRELLSVVDKAAEAMARDTFEDKDLRKI